jgi:hypothetical protein
MPALFDFAVTEMCVGFDEVEATVPSPQKVQYLDGYTWRYVEKTDKQAMVLKLARLISGLRAGRLLLNAGYVLELGILQRALDETEQDLMFLCGPYLGGEREERHEKFLKDFFEEEFDRPGDAIGSAQKRGMVSREKIMAYNARVFPGGDPSTNRDVSQTLHKIYSGYVHGAAGHIMDAYGGTPLHFHTAGLKGTSRHSDSERDFLNYPYRGLMTTATVAIALGLEVRHRLYQAADRFGKLTGLAS